MYEKTESFFGEILRNTEGHVELNQKTLPASKLSSRPICNILGTDKGINLKLSEPLLLLQLLLQLLLLLLVVTATVTIFDFDWYYMYLCLLSGNFRGYWARSKHTMCMLIVKRTHQQYLRNGYGHWFKTLSGCWIVLEPSGNGEGDVGWIGSNYVYPWYQKGKSPTF